MSPVFGTPLIHKAYGIWALQREKHWRQGIFKIVRFFQESLFNRNINRQVIALKNNLQSSRREQDSSPTRQFTDTVFEDSSPTELKTVHRHF